MSDTNIDLVRRWNQANTDPDVVRELVAPDFVAHMEDGDVRGPDGWLEFVRGMGPMRDVAAGIDEVLASGDLVGERWWMRGTTGDGEPFDWRGITMHRFADGRLQEDWVVVEPAGGSGTPQQPA